MDNKDIDLLQEITGVENAEFTAPNVYRGRPPHL